MGEVCLIIQKELLNFKVRYAMVRWYLTIILMNVFFVFLPGYSKIPITQNKGLLCLGFMAFTVFLVPNNLALDLVGGEKYHKTFETILSSPIDIRKAFLGKVIFIEALGILSIVAITILDNGLLLLIYKTSFFHAGVSKQGLIAIYMLLVSSILCIALIGSYIAFQMKDLKAGGYIVSLVDLGLVYLIMSNLRKINTSRAIGTAIVLFVIVLILSFFFICFLSKPKVMKKKR